MVYEVEDQDGKSLGYYRSWELATMEAMKVLGAVRQYEMEDEFPIGSCEDDPKSDAAATRH